MAWFLHEQASDHSLSSVLNWHDPLAKGRVCMLVSSVLAEIIKNLSTGALYTAFLTINGFDIVESGVILFLPLLASCVTVFSPIILERFRSRKWLLAGTRLLHYALNLLGTTLVTYLVPSHRAKLFLFGSLVLSASVINNLFISGYTVWHLNFIPNQVRARFFSLQQLIISVCATVCVFGFSFMADLLHGTDLEQTSLTAIRLICFACAVVDVVMLVLPREYLYPKGSQLRLSNILLLPLKDKRFLLTMSLLALWTFSGSITSSVWNYYLLNTVEMGATMANLWYICYTAALLLFSAPWLRLLERFSWFKTYAVAAILHGAAVVLSAFTARGNYLWLFPLATAIQGIVGVGLNIAAANLPFINMPEKDQTYYISFHTLFINVMSFLGSSAGTLFVDITGNWTFPVFGAALQPPQFLTLLQGGLFISCAVAILLLLKRLDPHT